MDKLNTLGALYATVDSTTETTIEERNAIIVALSDAWIDVVTEYTEKVNKASTTPITQPVVVAE